MPGFSQIQLGYTATREPVVWNAPRHIALQGMTRSGKTVATQAFLAQAARKRSIRVVGIDPTGVLLRPFSERGEKLVHCGTDDLTHAVKVLEEIVSIMSERIDRLWPARTDQIRTFNRSQPVVLTVLEEAPGLMSVLADDDAAQGRKPGNRLKPRAQRCLGRLLAEGAKVGVVVLVLAQRLSTEVLTGDARSNLGYRITLRMDDPDGLRMLHSKVSDEAQDFLATAAPGRGIADTPDFHHVRVALRHLDYEEYLRRLGF